MNKDTFIPRRKMVKWSIQVAALYPLAAISFYSCKPDDKKKQTGEDQQSLQQNNRRGKETVSYLLYNPKTKALHYPGIRKNKNDKFEGFQKVALARWQELLANGAHFSKETSGMVFEKLALQNFKASPIASGISQSLAITAKAFEKEYGRQNKMNWRHYELLLQWIALDETIGLPEKGAKFKSVTQAIDLALLTLPKRMKWAAASETINQRAAYIFQQKNKYLERLQNRTV